MAVRAPVKVLKPGSEAPPARTLKEYLSERGISIGQLARGTRRHRTNISRLVNGHRGSTLDTLQRIAAYLGVSMDRLLAMVGKKQVEIERAKEAS